MKQARTLGIDAERITSGPPEGSNQGSKGQLGNHFLLGSGKQVCIIDLLDIDIFIYKYRYFYQSRYINISN